MRVEEGDPLSISKVVGQSVRDIREDLDEEVLEVDVVLVHGEDYVGPNEDLDVATQPAPVDGLPSLELSHRSHIYTTTHVPKSARAQWARLLADVIWGVVRQPSLLMAWVLLATRRLLKSKSR